VPRDGALAPMPSATALFYVAFASAAQVLATALMLLAMRENSFVVATALTKTEAVQIVAFGMVFWRFRDAGAVARGDARDARRLRARFSARIDFHSARRAVQLAGRRLRLASAAAFDCRRSLFAPAFWRSAARPSSSRRPRS